MMQAAHRRRTAFTLMEILIVVLLIGILAAMVFPKFVDAEDQVLERAVRNELQMLRSQIQYYRFKENQYPPDMAAMVAAGYLDHEPNHPPPGSYNYDAATGVITSSEDPTW